MGNNNIPYPIAFGKNNKYLLQNRKIEPKYQIDDDDIREKAQKNFNKSYAYTYFNPFWSEDDEISAIVKILD